MAGGTHRCRDWKRGVVSTALLAIALLAPASAQASPLVTPQPAAASKPIVPAAAPVQNAAAPSAPAAPQAPAPSAGSQTSSGRQSSQPDAGPLPDGIPDNTDDLAMTDLAPKFQSPFIQNPFASPTIGDIVNVLTWEAGVIDPGIFGKLHVSPIDPGISDPIRTDQGPSTQGPDPAECPKEETPAGRDPLCLS